MTSDISEQMDEYCQEKYGHTNWGYLSTYEDHELKHAEECGATYDTENNIIFWHHDLEEEEEQIETPQPSWGSLLLTATLMRSETNERKI